jgi:hypothetical protein
MEIEPLYYQACGKFINRRVHEEVIDNDAGAFRSSETYKIGRDGMVSVKRVVSLDVLTIPKNDSLSLKNSGRFHIQNNAFITSLPEFNIIICEETDVLTLEECRQ